MSKQAYSHWPEFSHLDFRGSGKNGGRVVSSRWRVQELVNGLDSSRAALSGAFLGGSDKNSYHSQSCLEATHLLLPGEVTNSKNLETVGPLEVHVHLRSASFTKGWEHNSPDVSESHKARPGFLTSSLMTIASVAITNTSLASSE